MKAKSKKSMRHTHQEVQDIIDYDFLNQELDDYIKLDILYYELDRLEKTLETLGTPYVFLDPDEAEITVQNGKRRFEEHAKWIRERLTDGHSALPNPGAGERLDDLYNSLIDVLWREDVHTMIILTLAQIVIVQGLDQYYGQNN
jgi:hypothetical protein